MKRTIQVFLGNEARRLGTLHFDAVGIRQRAAFEYAETWLRVADRFAIDPALPLVTGPQFYPKSKDGSVFHAAIADTEPDGWARRVILLDHAKRRQQTRRMGEQPTQAALNDMDFLLAVDDASRVGALRFCDEQGVFCRAAEPGRRTAPPLVELGRLQRRRILTNSGGGSPSPSSSPMWTTICTTTAFSTCITVTGNLPPLLISIPSRSACVS